MQKHFILFRRLSKSCRISKLCNLISMPNINCIASCLVNSRTPTRSISANVPDQGKLTVHLPSVLKWAQGVGNLASDFPFWRSWIQQKAGCLHESKRQVSPMVLLMSLNRRMCDCDKLIDPFCGNRAALITGNAVQLSHIRSLTWSRNNKLTQSSLFFPSGCFF